MILTVALTGAVWAQTFEGGSIESGKINGNVFDGRSDFIEGWNVDGPFDGSWYYAADCQGLAYTPSQSYWLDRIEFMAGEVAGTAVIELHAEDGSGFPTGELLSIGSYEQSATLGWQGADMVPCVSLVPGVTYYINWRPVIGGPSSFATGGVVIPNSWAFDCVTWEGPGASHYWMVKFFGGTAPSGTEASTWSCVKALYR
jgi:hypothetical protein